VIGVNFLLAGLQQIECAANLQGCQFSNLLHGHTGGPFICGQDAAHEIGAVVGSPIHLPLHSLWPFRQILAGELLALSIHEECRAAEEGDHGAGRFLFKGKIRLVEESGTLERRGSSIFDPEDELHEIGVAVKPVGAFQFKAGVADALHGQGAGGFSPVKLNLVTVGAVKGVSGGYASPGECQGQPFLLGGVDQLHSAGVLVPAFLVILQDKTFDGTTIFGDHGAVELSIYSDITGRSRWRGRWCQWLLQRFLSRRGLDALESRWCWCQCRLFLRKLLRSKVDKEVLIANQNNKRNDDSQKYSIGIHTVSLK